MHEYPCPNETEEDMVLLYWTLDETGRDGILRNEQLGRHRREIIRKLLELQKMEHNKIEDFDWIWSGRHKKWRLRNTQT